MRSRQELEFLAAFESSNGFAFVLTFKRRSKMWQMTFPQRIINRRSHNAPGGGTPLRVKAPTLEELLCNAARLINETTETIVIKKAVI